MEIHYYSIPLNTRQVNIKLYCKHAAQKPLHQNTEQPGITSGRQHPPERPVLPDNVTTTYPAVNMPTDEISVESTPTHEVTKFGETLTRGFPLSPLFRYQVTPSVMTIIWPIYRNPINMFVSRLNRRTQIWPISFNAECSHHLI